MTPEARARLEGLARQWLDGDDGFAVSRASGTLGTDLRKALATIDAFTVALTEIIKEGKRGSAISMEAIIALRALNPPADAKTGSAG